MEENTVLSNATDIQTPQADAAAVGEVNVNDLYNEAMPQGETVVEQDAQPAQQADAAPERLFTRQEFDEAVRRKAEYLQKGIQNDPYYQAGRALAQKYGNMNPMEAAQKLIQENVEARAQELAQNPQELARQLLMQQIPQMPQVNMVQEQARQIAADLKAMHDLGELPEGFNLDAYAQAYPNFISDAKEYGARAAVKIAAANIQAQQLSQNRALPQSTRPNNNAQPEPIDFKRMTSAQFADFERRMDQAILEGKRIT